MVTTRTRAGRVTRALRRDEGSRATPRKHRLVGTAKEVHDVIASYGNDPRGTWAHDPPASRMVPHGGGWIVVSEILPSVEGALDDDFGVGRVYYAQHALDADEDGFSPSGFYKLRVTSQRGEMMLWPWEYIPLSIEKVIACWQGGYLTFHPTEIEASRMNAVVFYAQSRGIHLADAAVMALGSLRWPVGWFEPNEEFVATVEMLGRLGGGLRAANHARRRLARQRREKAS